MDSKTSRREKGSALIRSVILLVVGLGFIPLGMSFLPVIGILIGAVLMMAAIYPWVPIARKQRVKVLISTVSDNYLESMRLCAAILSATGERDGFDFDPGQVDPASVRFGPLRAPPSEDMSDPEVYRRSLVDLNNDGVPDLLLYFHGDTAGITADDRNACLQAKMRNGERIFGCGRVEYDYEGGLNEMVEYK